MSFIQRNKFSFFLISLAFGFCLVSPIVLPKYTARMLMISVLMLLEIYGWNIITKEFPKLFLKRWKRTFVFFAYWLPFFTILITIVTALIYPVFNWNPPVFVYVFGSLIAYYISKFFFLLFLLISEIIFLLKIAFKWAMKKNMYLHNSLRKIFLRIGFYTGMVLFALIVSGNVFWLYDFKVRTLELSFKNLPKAFDGLRVVQISDVHLGSMITNKPLLMAIQMIDSLHPDLVFFTGDLVNNFTGEALRFEKELGTLKAPMGVFSILGNHDYGDYVPWDSPSAKEKNFNDLIGFQKRIGWKLLLNENMIIRRDTTAIAIVGIENWGKSNRFPKKGNINKALLHTEGIPFKLLLSHDPTAWGPHIEERHRIDVTFSGHTHGMQFGIETESFRWSPAAWMYQNWAGLSDRTGNEGNLQYLYVNAGLGSIGIPSRVGIFPEITLFVLRSK